MSIGAPDISIFESKKDWKDPLKMGGFLDDARSYKANCNTDTLAQAEMNIAWYQGLQNQWFNPSSRKMMERPFDRLELIYNYIGQHTDAFVSKLGQQRLTFDVLPVTGDVNDDEVAKLGTNILDYYNRFLDLERFMDESDIWAALTGHAFAKVTWDSAAGNEFTPTAAEIGLDEKEFSKQFGDTKKLFLGEIAVTFTSLFNIAWGPEDTKFKDADFVVELHERSVAYVMERYGLKRDDISRAQDTDITVWRPGALGTHGSIVKTTNADDSRVVVTELWARPNVALGIPFGWHVVQIGDSTDFPVQEPIPYRHGEIPITDMPLLINPGESIGAAIVTNAIPPQHDLNRAMSQMAEVRESSANPKTFYIEGSVDENDIDNNPGGWVGVGEGFSFPQQQAGQSIDGAVIQEIQLALRALQDIFSLRDVTQGRNPPGVRSAQAIQDLQGADDLRFDPLLRRRRAYAERIGRMILQTAADFVIEPRIIRILGEDDATRSISFTGDMLTGEAQGAGVNYFDVRLRVPGRSRSRAAEERLALAMLQTGGLDMQNPTDRALFVEMTEMGDTHRKLDRDIPAKENQRSENMKMAAGEYVPPQMWQSHDVELRELQRFRYTGFYKKLPEQTQQLFIRHEMDTKGMMALRPFFDKAIGKQALQKAGIIPPQEDQSPTAQRNAQSAQIPGTGQPQGNGQSARLTG